ncbi:MAG: hypothetical protein E6767_16230 [Dysgonomonas sp.]|nr:hypothetical protein [Dysgonomonas sp.]
MKAILYILLILIFYSCSDTKKNTIQPSNTITDPVSVVLLADTIERRGLKMIDFGNDSTYVFDRVGRDFIYSVIYTSELKSGDVHYKIFNRDGSLSLIAHVIDTMLFDTAKVGYIYPRVDSLTEFHPNGKPSLIGYKYYWEEEDFKYSTSSGSNLYTEYDTLGRKTSRLISVEPSGWPQYNETYHSNGELKSRWKGDFIYNSGGSLWGKSWDEKGRLISQYKTEHFFPDWGDSYNNRFTVETTIDYYPGGGIKQISKHKSFVESEECPCGEWEYYNRKGELIHTQKYKPCYNFKLECD